MRYRGGLATSSLLLGLVWGCGGTADTGSTFSDTGIYNPGMGGVGNQGPMNQYVPTNWSYLFFRENFGELFDCINTGLCGHGGADIKFGTMGNGQDSLVYVLTANYFSIDANAVVVVRASGVQRDAVDLPASPADKQLRLAFQYAFLTSRTVAGDSAVIRVVVDGDTTARVVLLRVRSSDLGSSIPLRSGGCGTERIPSDPANTTATVTTYSRCSDWLDAELDVSDQRGHSIETQFVVGEAGTDTDQGIALLIRRVRIQQED